MKKIILITLISFCTIYSFGQSKNVVTFNYVNHKGGTTKLEELKGKYVYIDVWATWCGPCRGEIPFLQKMNLILDCRGH